MAMTGGEVLAQVREALNEGSSGAQHWRNLSAALDSLDGCVLLTAEEAETVRVAIASDPVPEFVEAYTLLLGADA